MRTFNKSVRTATALAALVSVTFLAATVASAPARAQGGYDEPAGDVDLDTFYRELAPYGEWFMHPRWGTVWRPRVDQDWRPYTRGHWASSEEYGWIWVAEEEWGWAPFHYGRWAHDETEDEWLWIPGTEWAPAWVMWRQSDDLVGWAPLPPDAIWEAGYGLRFAGTAYEGPRYYGYWSFVRPEYMFVPGLYRYLMPRDQYRSFWGRTTWVRDNHRLVNGHVYHGGIERRWVESRVGRPVPLVSLRSVRDPREQGWRASRNPAEVPVYRPRVTGLGATPPDWVRRTAPDRRPAVGEPEGSRRSVTISPGPMRPVPGDERRFERRGPTEQPPPREVRREVRPDARPPAQPQSHPQAPAARPAPTQERRGPQPQPYEPRG